VPHNIAIAKPEDVALLEEHMPTGSMPDTHQRRFMLQQEGKGLYVVAWQESLPVGYVLLHFRHPAHHASWKYYPECAYAEGLSTHPDKQRQGIAMSLMQSTEAYAKRNQVESIGLSVGTDNLSAQALYRKIAYQPTDIPSYVVTWNYLDKITGEVKEEGELCNFWLKRLDEILSSVQNENTSG
jgi:ribosomal protein S18 acetylase RimI-like enzyme